MTPRAETHSRVERARHSSVVGMCWSMVFMSVEKRLRMLPRGVVSNSLEARGGTQENHLLQTGKHASATMVEAAPP